MVRSDILLIEAVVRYNDICKPLCITPMMAGSFTPGIDLGFESSAVL